LKLGRSAKAYLPGTTVKFYEWLETAESKVRKGPAIRTCGDCSLGNLSPVSESEEKVEIRIRDLHQRVIRKTFCLIDI
jgi:uncharacterized protein (DUF2252 family)